MVKCIIIFGHFVPSYVLGVFEAWEGFNNHSEQPDFHFILSSAIGSGRVVELIVYLLL